MGRMRLPSVGLGGIARCRSPPFFSILGSYFTKLKKRLALGAFLAEPYRILLGETDKGRGQPCMVLLDPVSEGQLNERLMNAAGSDEPITRTRSVCFLSKNHSLTLLSSP